VSSAHDKVDLTSSNVFFVLSIQSITVSLKSHAFFIASSYHSCNSFEFGIFVDILFKSHIFALISSFITLIQNKSHILSANVGAKKTETIYNVHNRTINQNIFFIMLFIIFIK
jgi:hypothetical protein